MGRKHDEDEKIKWRMRTREKGKQKKYEMRRMRMREEGKQTKY